MRLTEKEKEVLTLLRGLDAQQRDTLLAKIRRTAVANRITQAVGRKAGALKTVRTVPDHKIVRAFGLVTKKV